MTLRHIAAGEGHREAFLLPDHGDPGAQRQRIHWRQLDRGTREHEGSQGSDLVGRLPFGVSSDAADR